MMNMMPRSQKNFLSTFAMIRLDSSAENVAKKAALASWLLVMSACSESKTEACRLCFELPGEPSSDAVPGGTTSRIAILKILMPGTFLLTRAM